MNWDDPVIQQEYIDIDFSPIGELVNHRVHKSALSRLAKESGLHLPDLRAIIHENRAVKTGTARKIITAAKLVFTDSESRSTLQPVIDEFDRLVPHTHKEPVYVPPTNTQLSSLLDILHKQVNLSINELALDLKCPAHHILPPAVLSLAMANAMRRSIIAFIEDRLDVFKCPYPNSEQLWQELVAVKRRYVYHVLNEVLPEQGPHQSWLRPAVDPPDPRKIFDICKEYGYGPRVLIHHCPKPLDRIRFQEETATYNEWVLLFKTARDLLADQPEALKKLSKFSY